MEIAYDQVKNYTFSCTRYQKDLNGFNIRVMQEAVQKAIETKRHLELKCQPEELEDILTYLDNHNRENDHEGRAPKEKPSSFSETELINAAQYEPENNLLRYLVYRYKFKNYPRERKLNDFPIVLAVEPTSICNLRCIMCFQADPSFTRDKSQMGLMDFNLYTRILDEAAQAQCPSLVLASRGEPFLHPKFTKMVAYAKEKGILDIKINTNATKLTATKSRELLQADPNVLIFSVDSSNKEEFEEIRVGADFDEIVNNIRTFNKIRVEEFPRSRLRTRISMVLINPAQDTAKARDFWSDLVDEFAVKGSVERLDVYNLKPVEVSDPCSLLWERLYVWWDGKINPCDSDYKSLLSPGTIAEGRTIQSVWLGKEMDAYRKSHLQGMKNTLYPCSRCEGYCL